MSYIFMDESGDLGFDFSKKATSKNFIIAMLLVRNKRPVDKIVGKTFASLSDRVRKTHSGVLHCNKEKPRTRIKLLTLLGEKKDFSIVIIRLNKKRVYSNFQKEKVILYNYVANILLDRIFKKRLLPLNEPVHFIPSKRETNTFLNQNFKGYITDEIFKKHKLKINMELKRPCDEKGLQAVDFVSWASFRKYEYQEEYYYNLLKDIIVEDSSLFGN